MATTVQQAIASMINFWLNPDAHQGPSLLFVAVGWFLVGIVWTATQLAAQSAYTHYRSHRLRAPSATAAAANPPACTTD